MFVCFYFSGTVSHYVVQTSYVDQAASNSEIYLPLPNIKIKGMCAVITNWGLVKRDFWGGDIYIYIMRYLEVPT